MRLGSCVIATVIVLGMLWTPRASHGLEGSELWGLYREGEASFHQANELVKSEPQRAKDLFLKAALSFERIVREGGIENGKLFYNIGNCYFRLGDMGRAILNYRRAETFIPNDINLQQNLDFARSRCLDKIEARSQTQVFRILFFWHYDLGQCTRSLLFLVFFNLIWAGFAVYLFKRAVWLRRVVLCCTFMALLLGASVGVEAWQQSRVRYGVVVAREVVARKGDSTTYEPSFKEPLHAGTELTLVEDRKGWYQVELADGRRCWIPESSAELI